MTESFVYMTCATMREAEDIGRVLVERRLAACVNVLGAISSMYWWQGRVERGEEVSVIAKTRTELVPELTEAVRAMHGYDVPCVVALPIEGGNPDFLAWIREETRPGGRGEG
ncbi:divalent cation tolerance protein CutA [Pseudodesulfovibrio sp. F-1]|uniref:Divalent cation tolerance protein CutA n=1 Tax=Pseudodesulfovibrio alkaliphilus TaxID=2661613 RepID=A0A7K1KPW2_9BACT|nr:divalent-cation tolerance protein CutA [Pseudodesulfovibrio alkaliphilus]MUM78129.1 divalent cation tolerance protein CutA [Pseudodesulfovibrio alkaliphilus]